MKSKKSALLLSFTSLLICFAMLVGSTFAWFTDTATTGVNKITSGNLHVEIQNKDNQKIEKLEWVKENGTVIEKQEDILWEPGCTYLLTPFKIVNTGNLALKYKIVITGLDGDSPLLDVIKFTYKGEDDKAVDISAEGHLTPAGTDGAATGLITVSAHMDEAAGNDYQDKTLENVKFTVYATQDTVENDSYGPTYDKDATYYPVLDAAGLKDALVNGGNIKVDDDVDTGKDVMIATKDTTLDMNGKTIKNTEDIWTGNGDDGKWSLISARDGANLTITGNGTFKAKENDAFAVDVQDGATVTIEDGTFIGNLSAVYVEEGTAIIEGGFFDIQQKEAGTGEAQYKFMLNCLDENYKNDKAKIIVYGGTFVNYDPSRSDSENPRANFVAEGYSVISEQHGEDTWYTVVKGTGVVAGSQEALNDAINNNTSATVKLTEAGPYTLPVIAGNKTVTILGDESTVIDMRTSSIIGAQNTGLDLTIEGATVQFANEIYKGVTHSKKLTYKDCTIKGLQFLYANEVEFINCKFVQDVVEYNVWTYGAGKVLFQNCEFECVGKAVLVYRENGQTAVQTVEFQNCKFNASALAEGKAAIEIDSSLVEKGFTVTIDKATADSVTGFDNGSVSKNTVWNNKKGTKATVIVNGETVLAAE